MRHSSFFLKIPQEIASSIAEHLDPESRGNTQYVASSAEIGGWCLAHSVLAAEFVDASASIDDFLLAGVERVAGGAHLYEEILAKRRARRKFVATTTSDLDVGVIGVNIGFHVGSPERAT
jgi:2-keto-3-deoxy-galactonokinase